MAWMKKGKVGEAGPPTPLPPAAPSRKDGTMSLIGPSLVIDGTVRTEENLLISGLVKGVLESSSQVLVAPGGRVEGEVRCRHLVIQGEVNGNVEVVEQVVIEPSGRLIGDMTTRSFTCRPGGYLEGNSRMLAEDRSPQKAGKKPKPAPAQDE